MKKIMISQPMRGLTDEEIFENRKKGIEFINDLDIGSYEFVNTFLDTNASNDCKNAPLFYLSESLKLMSDCDAVYFCKGWEYARGCRIEHECAVQYGLEIFYE